MTPERKTRTRRSMLFVPGSNAAMLSNSFIYKADALMFDLEDSVALREKDTARRFGLSCATTPFISGC
ncbi:Citrate lyase subunit beta [Providencia stuartii]|nr:Citrate lyase subunit beta [Providencia stuartii]